MLKKINVSCRRKCEIFSFIKRPPPKKRGTFYLFEQKGGVLNLWKTPSINSAK
jgi:hypothetical protein